MRSAKYLIWNFLLPGTDSGTQTRSFTTSSYRSTLPYLGLHNTNSESLTYTVLCLLQKSNGCKVCLISKIIASTVSHGRTVPGIVGRKGWSSENKVSCKLSLCSSFTLRNRSIGCFDDILKTERDEEGII